ncbi:hypothetical protein [Methylobacterium longum]|uniref:Uncharacterized protein n=1 Tax=Methylobacterium longum TaxID=767694 RepID=A0ABT8AHL6_9HYPH|nr:hypothetical protein [Methylobacterium longum]MDN3569304.1 hypothetical protein [Methylobacterium longum]GJE14626.1 hypothetical protein FOHLNKBM_5701 [Methylobacterium longum]
MLDRPDGDVDLEDGAEAEQSLTAPENATGSQVVYMRGSDRDSEADVFDTVLPEVAVEKHPEPVVLPWRGGGNVIAAAGSLIVDLLERA